MNQINIDNPKFFKITFPKTKLQLQAIIWKLGENPNDHKILIDLFINENRKISKDEYVYLSINKQSSNFMRVGYMPGDRTGFEYYRNEKYNYCGVINVTPEDISNCEIYLDAKIYNL